MKLAAIWHKAAPTIVGIILALSIAGVGLTAVNSWEVRQDQDAHTAELQTIRSLEQQVATEGSRIERYARHLESQLRTEHGDSYRVLVRLCDETPDCVVPASQG